MALREKVIGAVILCLVVVLGLAAAYNTYSVRRLAAHEAAVTASIHALYETALAEKDYPAQVMLQWFINEQVEEEKNAAEIVANLELIEERGTAVLMLDKQLGKRSGE